MTNEDPACAERWLEEIRQAALSETEGKERLAAPCGVFLGNQT